MYLTVKKPTESNFGHVVSKLRLNQQQRHMQPTFTCTAFQVPSYGLKASKTGNMVMMHSVEQLFVNLK